jgi:hypothetical protein
MEDLSRNNFDDFVLCHALLKKTENLPRKRLTLQDRKKPKNLPYSEHTNIEYEINIIELATKQFHTIIKYFYTLISN